MRCQWCNVGEETSQSTLLNLHLKKSVQKRKKESKRKKAKTKKIRTPHAPRAAERSNFNDSNHLKPCFNSFLYVNNIAEGAVLRYCCVLSVAHSALLHALHQLALFVLTAQAVSVQQLGSPTSVAKDPVESSAIAIQQSPKAGGDIAWCASRRLLAIAKIFCFFFFLRFSLCVAVRVCACACAARADGRARSSACVDFFDEFLGVLIKGILQIGVVGSCGELCSLIPNQYGQVRSTRARARCASANCRVVAGARNDRQQYRTSSQPSLPPTKKIKPNQNSKKQNATGKKASLTLNAAGV